MGHMLTWMVSHSTLLLRTSVCTKVWGIIALTGWTEITAIADVMIIPSVYDVSLWTNTQPYLRSTQRCNRFNKDHCSRRFFSFLLFLPPGNEVCEGNVFTDVCLSTGGGACVAGGHAWQGHPWQGGIRGRGCAWQERWPLQRVVRILLEFILVFFHFIPYFRVMSSKNMSWTEISHVKPGSHFHEDCEVPSINKHFQCPWLYSKVRHENRF